MLGFTGMKTETDEKDWQQSSVQTDNADLLCPMAQRLQGALTEIMNRIVDHPAYSDLTEEQEMDVGGDTAELSYLARVAREALGHRCANQVSAECPVCGSKKPVNPISAVA
jgi:hypothetical protein